MQRIPVIIIGAGQAGLAMSHCLAAHDVDHAVFERGQVAERWRTERWDSLRLLTPNWMSRLPGWSYQGSDPDGFMTASQFTNYLGAYAQASGAPIETGVEVQAVRHTPWGYVVETNRGTRLSEAVIIATGHCDVPAVPAMARNLPAWIKQLTPSEYRNPGKLPDGGVLVVGASATGVQLAEEIQRSGRQVTIAVGRHTRLPRSYRGRDIWYWLEQLGMLDDPASTISDLRRARAQPSFQLVGHPDGRTIDLGTLGNLGVRLLGRAVAGANGTIFVQNDLPETVAAAQAGLERLLARIDVIANAADAPLQDDAAPLMALSSWRCLDDVAA
ncbi:MAG: NAD(P)-binding domain-containing protein [Rhodopila sp.]